MSNDPTLESAVDGAEMARLDSEKSQLKLFAEWLVENGLDFAELRGNYDGPFIEVPNGVIGFVDGKPLAQPPYLRSAYEVLWGLFQKG